MLNRRKASWTNAFWGLKHHLHIGACRFFTIFTQMCWDHGRNLFSACLFVPSSDYYGKVIRQSYRVMPLVEQTLASYLSPDATSSLKAPTLLSKPLRTSSALVGKGYAAAGQAGSCLHTMTVLQAYQADLLKELDEGEGVNAEDIKELCKTADLSLRATKETAHAIGRSIAALVAAERHLWLTMSDIKDRDGSSSWMPRFHLLACSAMLLVLSSKGGKKTLAMEGRSWDARHPFGGL